MIRSRKDIYIVRKADDNNIICNIRLRNVKMIKKEL